MSKIEDFQRNKKMAITMISQILGGLDFVLIVSEFNIKCDDNCENCQGIKIQNIAATSMSKKLAIVIMMDMIRAIKSGKNIEEIRLRKSDGSCPSMN